MEIGPVNGIRAISPVSVKRPESSAPPVFHVHESARADDETCSSSRQQSERGLEDEESESGDEETGSGSDTQSPGTSADSGVNLFA
jgi:hypothetical protein